MGERLKASCVAVVIGCRSVMISHSGGDYADCNVWDEEIDNSVDIGDIFYSYEMPSDKPGFYVWEGEIEPVFEDQPIFDGVWREATKEDMVGLIKD